MKNEYKIVNGFSYEVTNKATVLIEIAEDCNAEDMEFSASIVSFDEMLSIPLDNTGIDDFSLIREAIQEFDKSGLEIATKKREGFSLLRMFKSYEQNDVFTQHMWFVDCVEHIGDKLLAGESLLDLDNASYAPE
jgi:hypothetical protein